MWRILIPVPGGDKDRILDFINEQGLIVEYILTTHSHFDHTEEVSALRQEKRHNINAKEYGFNAL